MKLLLDTVWADEKNLTVSELMTVSDGFNIFSWTFKGLFKLTWKKIIKNGLTKYTMYAVVCWRALTDYFARW